MRRVAGTTCSHAGTTASTRRSWLFEPQHRTGLLANVDDVVLGNAERRHVGLLTVHGEVAVGNQLTSLATGACQTCAVNHVVQAGFQQDHQVVTGLTRTAVSLRVVTAELALQYTVGVLCLLLFLQLQEVLGLLDASAASLPRWVWAALEGAVTTDEVDAEATGLAGNW